MTFIYTPPEPYKECFNPADGDSYYTESQLRSEVERVRRETVEACAAENKRLRDALTQIALYKGNSDYDGCIANVALEKTK